MRAHHIVFTEPGAVHLMEQDMPAVDVGEVMIQCSRSLISTGTELTCLYQKFATDTHWDRWVRYPFHPGYSSVGRVLAVGSQVIGLKPQDRVAWHGCHASLGIVAAESAFHIPDSVSDDEATWFALAAIASLGAERAGIRPGDTVVVLGLGILGQLVVQRAAQSSPEKIIAVSRTPARVEQALSHGAAYGLDVDVEKVVPLIAESTGGRLADVVFDVTGNPDVLPYALRLCRRFGTVILLGDVGQPGQQRLTGDLLLQGLTLTGAHFDHAESAGARSHSGLANSFFHDLHSGRIRVADLITDRFPPSAAYEAYQTAGRHNSLGILFEWS